MSSKRLSPKEIKRDIRHDELRTLLTETVEQAQSHSRLVIAVVVGVIALTLAVTGTYVFLQNRKSEANRELAEAIQIYGAPVVEEDAKPDDPRKPSFASEEAREEKAKASFEKLEGGVGSSIAGEVAELYLAEMAAKEGDTARARQIWEDFLESQEDHVLAISVRVNLIHLDREEGKSEEVEARLRKELESAEKKLPEDVILFELAQTLDALERKDEAVELYQRLVDEYPRSAYSFEASQQISTAGA